MFCFDSLPSFLLLFLFIFFPFLSFQSIHSFFFLLSTFIAILSLGFFSAFFCCIQQRMRKMSWNIFFFKKFKHNAKSELIKNSLNGMRMICATTLLYNWWWIDDIPQDIYWIIHVYVYLYIRCLCKWKCEIDAHVANDKRKLQLQICKQS